MSGPFKSHPAEFDQRVLFPSNVFDLLPSDHECYLYKGLFDQIDTTSIEETYSLKGQRAYHPKQITSILIYAYSRGVFSSREIEKRCHEDLSFLYIAEMHCPNFRVLSDFRKKHGGFFQDCFKQTVRLAMELKLASLGHISLDGSKFQANSSKHKAMSYQRLIEKEQALGEEITALIEQAGRCDAEEDRAYRDRTGYELPEDLKHKESRLARIREAKQALEEREQALNPGRPIDGKKQISFADKDARIMGKHGDFAYRYNGQISVDKDHQVIVGQHLSQQANDQQEVEVALDQVEEASDRQADKFSADTGYLSGDNLEALEARGIDAYIATERGEKDAKLGLDQSERKLVKADFEYHETDNTFTCPGGQVLVMRQEGKDGKRIYRGDATLCGTCRYRSRCCQSSTGQARAIHTDTKEPLRQRMKAKMQTPEAKAVYQKRKVIVEPVFGQIKNGGFRRFSVRGKEKAAGEFALVCATHNFKKIAKSILQGLVRPEFGKWAANPA